MYSITAKRMISGLVLKYLNEAGLVIPKRYATPLPRSSKVNLTRPNRVHRELQGAISNGATIGSVAATYGFHHQGHFTNQYKRLFGCLPSETLHRN